MPFPLPEPITFDAGVGVQTITSLREADAVLARLPAGLREKPAFRRAAELIAKANGMSHEPAIVEATDALKAAFEAEGMARRP